MARGSRWPSRSSFAYERRGTVWSMSIVGDWDVTIKTPIGSLAVVYTFTDRDGALEGTATSKSETVPLHDIVVDRQRVTWRQSVTKPMRLNLEFDVVVDGDRLTGIPVPGDCHARRLRVCAVRDASRRRRRRP